MTELEEAKNQYLNTTDYEVSAAKYIVALENRIMQLESEGKWQNEIPVGESLKRIFLPHGELIHQSIDWVDSEDKIESCKLAVKFELSMNYVTRFLPIPVDPRWADNSAPLTQAKDVVESRSGTCPKCRHAWHGADSCLNMASDNACDCLGVKEVE